MRSLCSGTIARQLFVASALAVAGLGSIPAATAAPCEAPYSSDQLVSDVQDIERAIIAMDEKASLTLATRMQGALPCVDQRLSLAIAARIYRALGGGFYVGGDTKTAESWFRVAIEVDRTFRYGVEDLPSDHILRPAYASLVQAPVVEPVEITGKGFGPPGDYFLDGRSLDIPRARPDRPHLLQRAHDGSIETWLLRGASFPEDLLVDVKVDDNGKKRKKRGERTKFDVDIHEMGQDALLVDRSQPPEQIPLIAGGSVLILTGVGLYVGSHYSRRNFNTIRDDETRLRKSQQSTNRLVLGAIAAVAVGTGTLSYGIVIDDAGTPVGPRINVRF